jgi:transitional endoplasmic reticulum ATPase
MLADFGLAKVVDDVSWSEESAGRYGFLAPECFFGTYLPASDVFSAGIVLYRMVTGVFPWQYDVGVAADASEIQTAVLAGRKKAPVDPSVHNSACGRLVEEIILQSLSTDLTKRFQNAGDFLRALDDKFARRRSASTKATRQERAGESRSANAVQEGLNDVAGMDDLKEMLRNDVIGPLEDRELYEQYKLTVPNGLLLYGPPGCGKTYIARKFAMEVGYHFIEVKPSDVGSTYIHGSQKKIAKLFQTAKENAPTILFIDELDAVMPSRDQDIEHGYASEVNEFLSQMNDCGENDVFVIGATNRPERVDAAILRTGRIDKIEYVPPPDLAARKAMFEHHLKDRPCEEDLDFGKFAELTEGFVASDIEFLTDEASRLALKERSQINGAQIEQSILASSPSISAHQLNKYKAFASSRSFS